MDKIKAYVQLQKELIQERAQLQARLEQIEQALSATGTAPVRQSTFNAAQPGSGEPPRRNSRRPRRNQYSLAETVRRVLATRSLTKEEILKAVEEAGYVFGKGNRVNNLNTILYNKRNGFKHENKKFFI